MQARVVGLVLVGMAMAAGRVEAQQNAVAVQLPTFSRFTVSTSVVVPDRGGAYLGGVTRSQTGQARFGPPLLPGQRGLGGAHHAAGVQVGAVIHDLQAMDAAVLASSSPRAGGPVTAVKSLEEAAVTEGARAVPSVAQIRAQQAQAEQAAQDEALGFYQRAQAAEAAGKAGVAKIYYGMAVRRAGEPLRQEILGRLQALDRANGEAVAARPRR